MVFINYANIILKNAQGHRSKVKSHTDISGQNNGVNNDDDVPSSVDNFFKRFGQTRVSRRRPAQRVPQQGQNDEECKRRNHKNELEAAMQARREKNQQTTTAASTNMLTVPNAAGQSKVVKQKTQRGSDRSDPVQSLKDEVTKELKKKLVTRQSEIAQSDNNMKKLDSLPAQDTKNSTPRGPVQKMVNPKQQSHKPIPNHLIPDQTAAEQATTVLHPKPQIKHHTKYTKPGQGKQTNGRPDVSSNSSNGKGELHSETSSPCAVNKKSSTRKKARRKKNDHFANQQAVSSSESCEGGTKQNHNEHTTQAKEPHITRYDTEEPPKPPPRHKHSPNSLKTAASRTPVVHLPAQSSAIDTKPKTNIPSSPGSDVKTRLATQPPLMEPISSSTQTYPAGVAMIFYNTDDRLGAVDESRDLLLALQGRGFDVKRRRWSDPLIELKDLIRESASRVSAECKMVFMCIMGHGRAGLLKGADGKSLPLNDVMHLLKDKLQAEIPLVRP